MEGVGMKVREWGTASLVPVAPGPMARSVDDCEAMMYAWLRSRNDVNRFAPERRGPAGADPSLGKSFFELDARTPKQPWRGSEAPVLNKRRLRVGFVDGTKCPWMEPAAPVNRAVQEVIEALRAAGHEGVEFDRSSRAHASDEKMRVQASLGASDLPRDLSNTEAYRIYCGIMLGDGGMFGFTKALQGQTLFRDYGMMYFGANIPDVLRPLLLWVFRNVLGENRKAQVFQYLSKSSSTVRKLYQETTDGLREFQKGWLTQYKDLELDCLIMPQYPLPAWDNGLGKTLVACAVWTFVGNLLRWPIGQMPVTTVRSDEEVYEPKSHTGADSVARAMRQAMLKSQGLPVGVQIMCPEWEDEKVLDCMKIIDTLLQNRNAKR
jgi:amidase